jgi:ribonuclease HI
MEVGQDRLPKTDAGRFRVDSVAHSALFSSERMPSRTMQATTPHYFLYSETSYCGSMPLWKFVLQPVGRGEQFSASDFETEMSGGRLELLAVVRGLEALEGPARVTLLTRSRYVRRGIRRELAQWRERGWLWERFGQLVPIRDCDLWQRLDRALEIHQVDCWGWQLDDESSLAGGAQVAAAQLPFSKTPHASHDSKSWSIAATLGSLSRSLWTPISAIWGPPFTKAA